MKQPRPHQAEAIQKGIEHFRNYNRGKLIMPCGSGKTLTALWLCQELNYNHIIIAFPNLSLEYQTVVSWLKDISSLGMNHQVLVLGSDKKLNREFDIQVTTDVAETKAFLLKNKNVKTIIFTTYHSSGVITNAVEDIDFSFDFCVSDESHHTAGVEKSLFQLLLDDKNISVSKRLFMTATPKVLIGRGDNGMVKSMDDEEIYGSEFYRLSVSEAIAQGIISDYRVVSLYSSNNEVLSYIRDKRILKDDSSFIEEEEEIRLVSSAISICKAIKKYNLKRIITYHSKIKSAKNFGDLLTKVSGYFKLNTSIFHINGTLNVEQRQGLVKDFLAAEIGVFTNAKILTEGADIPAVDAVCFIDNRWSAVDVIQAAGRAWRLSEGKSMAYILIPCLISNDNMASQDLLSLRKILTYLTGQDERLGAYFRKTQKHIDSGRADDLVIQENMSISLNFEDLVSDINIRVWENVKNIYWMPLEEAKEWMQTNLLPLGINTFDKYIAYTRGMYPDAPERPLTLPKAITSVYNLSYKDIIGFENSMTLEEAKAWNFANLEPLNSAKEYEDMYGNGLLPDNMLSLSSYKRHPDFTINEDFIPLSKVQWSFDKFKDFALKNLYPTVYDFKTWNAYIKGEYTHLPSIPDGMRRTPQKYYESFSWSHVFPKKDTKFAPYKEQRKWVIENLVPIGIDGHKKFIAYLKGHYPDAPELPDWVRKSPQKDSDFVSYNDFFGKK